MKKSKTNTAENRQNSGLASASLIVYWLDLFVNSIYNACSNGFFGKLFTAYSKEQTAFESGFLNNHFTSGTKLQQYFRRVRQFISRSFQTSYFVQKLESYFHGLLAIPLKRFGNLLFSFGAYTILVYFVRLFVPGLTESGVEYAVFGAILCILSVPMLWSKDNVATAVGGGILTKAIFVDAFGFREEAFRLPTKKSKSGSNYMVLFGMLLGILTLFVDPLDIILVLLSIIGVSLVLSSPELGVIFALFFLPFFSFFESPVIMLGMLVLMISISYFIKLLRGKRILKIELLDLAVLLFLLVLFFSGTITAGGTVGYNEALISSVLMFGYFLVVNLMRTEKWLKRCVMALVSSGTIVAVIGILQYVLGIFEVGAWLDTEYFSDIRGRVVSLFDNPNILAFYLVLILPFSLFTMTKANSLKKKIVSGFSVLSILLCIVCTWCRGAWLASLLCLLLFALIYSKKSLRYLLLACFLIPFIPIILPDSVLGRLMSIGDLADSSTMYRVYTWKGTLEAIKEYFWGGIGYGPTAYGEIYPRFAYAGIEAAEHSHSLFLQILLGMGIGGLLIFLAVVLLSAQMNFEYIKTAKDRTSKLMVAASLCAVLASLFMGAFDFIWYNYRIFFLFWAILGLACACIRVGNDEKRRHDFQAVSEDTLASMDIQL
ncbi:MAG: hypothetical protein E7668_00330 [Ruminococcaceae bacterium]|nr:hypothetical protein [Oscillospiraceae bacterium]